MTPNSLGFGSYELSFSTKSTLLLQSLTRVCKIRNTRLAALHLQLEREHFAGKSIFSSTHCHLVRSTPWEKPKIIRRLGWRFNYGKGGCLNVLIPTPCWTGQLSLHWAASHHSSLSPQSAVSLAAAYRSLHWTRPWIMVMPEKISPNFYESSHFYKHQAFPIQQSNCFWWTAKQKEISIWGDSSEASGSQHELE